MSSRFSPVPGLAHVRIPSFALLNNIPFYVYTTLCLSFFCWTLGLPPLIIAKNAALNMGIHMFLWHLPLNSPRGGIATSYSDQFSSVHSLSRVRLWDPMDCSMHHLPEFVQFHVHWVSDYPTISSSVALFSSWPQSFPSSGSFPVSRLFASGG